MRKSRRVALLGVLYALWLVVPLTVWGDGYSDGGGLDGPCLGTGKWSSKHWFEGYGWESHAQLWPPGSVRCELGTPTGPIERVFPGTATYILATLLVLLPFPLWHLARRFGGSALTNQPRPG